MITPAAAAEVERIRKLNAGKAWGHTDSAVEHVARLLSTVDELSRTVAQLKAENKQLTEQLRAWKMQGS